MIGVLLQFIFAVFSVVFVVGTLIFCVDTFLMSRNHKDQAVIIDHAIADIKKVPGPYQKLLYKPRKFLTYTEHRFFKWLENEYGQQFYIVPQVVLGSIVDVSFSRELFAYKGYRSKIDKKTIDFVLFDKKDFLPMLAIELDDYTHGQVHRQMRDQFVDAVMEKVGIKILHMSDVFEGDN